MSLRHLADDAVVRDGRADRWRKILRPGNGQVNESRGLARLHEDELKRSRSAIQQFVLSPPAKAPAKANDEELSHK